MATRERRGVEDPGWFEERFHLRSSVARVLDRPVPLNITWYHSFGGLTFFAFIMLVVTGVTLAFFYVPDPEHARSSVAWFSSSVPLGSLVRSVHLWSAYAMVLLVFLHMLRVFVHGAYRKPRELNWILGMLMFLIVQAFAFTGYLLPWDQKAYWATNVGLNIVDSIPIVGPLITDLLRGGPTLGALTLLRFYGLHVFVLPAILGIGLILHFAMVRRQGIATPL